VAGFADPGGPIPPATLGLVAVLELAVDGVGDATPSPAEVPRALTVDVRAPATGRVVAAPEGGATDARGRAAVEAVRAGLVVPEADETVEIRRAAAEGPVLVAVALGRVEAEPGVAAVLALDVVVAVPAVRAAASRAEADEAGVPPVLPAMLFRGEAGMEDFVDAGPNPPRLADAVDAEVGVGRAEAEVDVVVAVEPATGLRVGMNPLVGFAVGTGAFGAGEGLGVPAAISRTSNADVTQTGGRRSSGERRCLGGWVGARCKPSK